MTKWYEHPDLERLAQASDNALDAENCDELLEIAECCEVKSKNESIHPFTSARFLYCAFTCYSSILKLSSHTKMLEFDKQEEYAERAIYNARKAYDIYHESLFKGNLIEEEQVQLIACYAELAINYSYLLYDHGRIVESISVLSSPRFLGVPLVKGCLGSLLTYFSFFYWDSSHQQYILYRAYKLLSTAIDKKNTLYNAQQLHSFIQSKDYIENVLNKKFLSSEIQPSDFIMPFENLSDAEEKYRYWVAKNNLALNLLNDVEKHILFAYDPLHLPNMRGNLETQKPAVMQSLFNQIKQEYVSARFIVYEGITSKKQHYSDKNVLLINTLDFPLYCLDLEKVKFGFRACYSILDSIAFLMNEYFELGISEQHVSYKNIWGKTSKLLDLLKDNPLLMGLWWLYKDIRSSYASEYKPNTKEFKRIVKIRNAMEHRSLKIVRYNIDSEVAKKLNADKISYVVSFEDFEKLTVKLFKYVRETIILLLFAIHNNEGKKETQGLTMPIISNDYLDNDKSIF